MENRWSMMIVGDEQNDERKWKGIPGNDGIMINLVGRGGANVTSIGAR